jgi:hypothetical protein
MRVKLKKAFFKFCNNPFRYHGSFLQVLIEPDDLTSVKQIINCKL